MNQNETNESSESVDNEEKSLIEVEQEESDAEKKNTSSGLEENIAGLLCYLAGPLTGIIFFILEKENRFIRFHALQSIITFIALAILNYVLSAVPFVGWMFGSLISLLTVALWVVLMMKAYQRETFKLPIIGDIAEQQVNK